MSTATNTTGINPAQLRELVVIPTLEWIVLYSLAAEQLVMGTAAQESKFRHIKQLGEGPALGLWQMEPATHKDIWDNYLFYNQTLSSRVGSMIGHYPLIRVNNLIGNLYYACAMCRIHYRRVKSALPKAGDVEGMAKYWKIYYNTRLGKGTEAEYIANWNKFVAPIYR